MTYSRELFNDDVMRYVYLVLPFHEVLLIQLPSDLCHRQLHKHSLCKQCSLSDPKSFNLKTDTIFLQKSLPSKLSRPHFLQGKNL